MKAQTLVLAILGALFVAFVLLAPPVAAQAEFVHGDLFESPLVVDTLPYQLYVDTSLVASETGEPVSYCAYDVLGHTFWFKYEPTQDVAIESWTDGWGSVLTLYTGTDLASLSQVTCTGGPSGHISAVLNAGTTYYFQVGTYSWETNQFSFVLQELPPLDVGFYYVPTEVSINQEFNIWGWVANLVGMSATALIDFGDFTTTEVYVDSWSPEWSAYHSYAAAGDYLVRVTVTSQDGRMDSAEATIHVPTPPDLWTEIYGPDEAFPHQWVEFSGPVWNTAGLPTSGIIDFGDNSSEEVYVYDNGWGDTYFSVGHAYAAAGDYVVSITLTSSDGRPASAQRTIHVITPPALELVLSGPEEVSPNQWFTVTGQLANMMDFSASGTIDFGDGSTAEVNVSPWYDEFHVGHSYAAEGDYSVSITLTSDDGRMVSGQHTVRVRNHDVAIVSINAPQSARVSQVRTIVIALKNYYDDATVTVHLYRNDAPEAINYTKLLVPARSGNRTTNVEFTYTFTQEDADAGKVTFRATAEIEGVDDINPADNQVVSTPPTRVSGVKAQSADLGSSSVFLPMLQHPD